jgi:uncharacterized membrane protein (UPF0127 family)
MKAIRAGAFALALISTASIPGCERNGKNSDPRVVIGSHSWKVLIAETEDEKEKGLSNRSDIADDQGMLFVYSRPQILEFCMRDCRHPLDIIFISSDLRVLRICEMQVEEDMEGRVIYSSKQPASYALEIKGGTAAKKGISEGDDVRLIGIVRR